VKHDPKEPSPLRIQPRLLDKELAAEYCSVSTDVIELLINKGHVSVVKLPVSRSQHRETSTKVLVDRVELDELIPVWRERRGE
jgi:hypothetical protein